MSGADQNGTGRPILPDENPNWDGVVKHSTRGPSAYAYKTLGCRCPECYALGSGYRAKRRRDDAERIAARKAEGDIPHGITGYRRYKCDCEVCREAGAAHNRQRSEMAVQKRRESEPAEVDWEALAHLRAGHGVRRPRRQP